MVRTAGAVIPAQDGFDPAAELLGTWQSLSGYAHARLWPTLPGREVKETDPTTNMQTVTQKGDANRLLDTAFRALRAVEEALRRLVSLSTTWHGISWTR